MPDRTGHRGEDGSLAHAEACPPGPVILHQQQLLPLTALLVRHGHRVEAGNGSLQQWFHEPHALADAPEVEVTVRAEKSTYPDVRGQPRAGERGTPARGRRV
jgi:hypothetical protein